MFLICAILYYQTMATYAILYYVCGVYAVYMRVRACVYNKSCLFGRKEEPFLELFVFFWDFFYNNEFDFYYVSFTRDVLK